MRINSGKEQKRTSIFFLITSIQVGGAEMVVFSLCEFLKRGKNISYEPVLFELYKTNSAYANSKREKLKDLGIKYKTLGCGGKYLSRILSPFFLWWHILKKEPEIIHSHTDLPDFVLAFNIKIFRRHKFRIIRTIHNVALWPTHHRLGKFTEPAFKNDVIIAVSDAAMQAYEDLRETFHLNVSPVRNVIFNGCAVPSFLEHQFKIDKKKINIAFAGELGLRKGADILINIIINIPDEYKSKVIFHIIGQGNFRSEVLSLSNNPCCVILYEPVTDLCK